MVVWDTQPHTLPFLHAAPSFPWSQSLPGTGAPEFLWSVPTTDAHPTSTSFMCSISSPDLWRFHHHSALFCFLALVSNPITASAS